jgi:hypothetical protein
VIRALGLNSRSRSAGAAQERCGWFMPALGRRLGTRNRRSFVQDKAEEVKLVREEEWRKRSGL